jgi:hypothetical protein
MDVDLNFGAMNIGAETSPISHPQLHSEGVADDSGHQQPQPEPAPSQDPYFTDASHNSRVFSAGAPSHFSSQPIPAPPLVFSSIEHEEAAPDKEMMHFIRRRRAEELANGANEAELADKIRVPDAIEPTPDTTPACTPISFFGTRLALSFLFQHSYAVAKRHIFLHTKSQRFWTFIKSTTSARTVKRPRLHQKSLLAITDTMTSVVITLSSLATILRTGMRLWTYSGKAHLRKCYNVVIMLPESQ